MLGAINYLSAIVPLDVHKRREVDVIVKDAARQMAHLPAGSANALIWTHSRFITARAALARDRERLLLQLQHPTNRDTLAAELMRALVAEPPKRAALYGPVPNGALTALRARSRDVADGAVVVIPASYADISRAAHVFARAVAYNEVVRELHGAVPPPGNGGAMISLPLPAQGSRALTATLHFGFVTPATALGDRYGSTPVSVAGPGCSGSLLALADRGRYPCLSNALLGVEAFARAPWAHVVRFRRGGPLPVGDYAERFQRRTCRLCGGAELSLYHLVCDCSHTGMVEARASITRSVPSAVDAIVRGALAALDEEGVPRPNFTSSEEAAVDALLSSHFRIDGTETRFLVFWLLMCTPWPRFATLAGPEPLPAAAALGALFDALNVQPRRLRSWAREWLSWSEAHLLTLAGVWRQQV